RKNLMKTLAAALTLGLAVALTGCGNTAEKVDDSTGSPDAGASTSAKVTGGTEVQLPTASGVLKVALPAGDNPPGIEVVKTPFSVQETQVKTLKQGDGPVVAADATVSVDYLGVNGRDGKSFDSSYERGSAATFPLYGVVPGFAKAIAGQKVGSDVLVAMTPADGYGPSGQPAAGIEGEDTLIFFIHINEVQ
ncbi:MAG TPA: FKBP-type peptidyl-prolyl cis-trans isomerase, partial [Marmoricola sp.]|nr:FKBP-type peptidyl-prolyl cis-trans isomerase [Marmoricola sp.]